MYPSLTFLGASLHLHLTGLRHKQVHLQKRKRKDYTFCINSIDSQVLYQAAQAVHLHLTGSESVGNGQCTDLLANITTHM